MTVREKLAELGITLPAASAPMASYVPVVVAGNLAFVSGQIARKGDHVIFKGKLGDAISVDQGAQCARETALTALAALEAEGLLDRVERVVKVTGYVASTPTFADHSKVVNGASDLLVQIFGDAGKHARTSVGVAGLPLGAPVEVDFVFEIR
ncbi:MAG TPA: RidA family protein [Thermoplasmata archaeon]|jgi:enamine deaminase RidA (YjgF/YER057c/UK114 family)|nr:RidA family protein [Thermoplasmata archaeon]